MAFETNVYVVQKADKDDNLNGPVLAVKLTYEAAHAIAKRNAPCKVTLFMANKDQIENWPDFSAYRDQCKQLQLNLFELP